MQRICNHGEAHSALGNRVADADFELGPGLRVRAALLYDLEHPEHLIGLIATVSRRHLPMSACYGAYRLRLSLLF